LKRKERKKRGKEVSVEREKRRRARVARSARSELTSPRSVDHTSGLVGESREETRREIKLSGTARRALVWKEEKRKVRKRSIEKREG